MQLEVVNIKGEGTGRKVQLPEDIFGVEPNDHIIYLDVKRYLNGQRQGTHKAKERSEMSGSTRKLFRQKGTGGARRGDINSPLLRGGARVFGPRPRNYDIKLNKKEKALARKSALAYKVRENNIVVVESFDFNTPKTKSFLEVLKALNLENQKSLFITNNTVETVVKSARNIQTTDVQTVGTINTYSILHANKIILTEDAVSTLTENLK